MHSPLTHLPHMFLHMRKTEGTEHQTGDMEHFQAPGSDPYNSAPASAAPGRLHRLRHSESVREDMKTATAQIMPTPVPTSDLALRLAGMRVELERVLAEMERLCVPAADRSDQASMRLLQKLRESARHLDDAIDSLLPPDE